MKIICIGRNYVDHVKELKNDIPASPVFFMKPDSALVTGNRPFFYPDFSNLVHHELEVVIRINRLGRSIEEKYAGRYFSELALGVDFTARDLQNEMRKKGLPWEIAKGFDYSAPVSAFVPVSKFRDIHNLSFRLDLNGKTVQDGTTSLMIFSFEKIIAYVSGYITLKKGVGPVSAGDRLEAFLEGDKMMDFRVK
jgi:acylpyruvate hydrolase